ncbi:MAG: (d)CMP kinase, partial [Lentisphaeria bacterium]|nr:(d)CMP kinase [Lentisphaeria bacterium]
MSVNVIAVDGPAASGKSTLARNLAERLGILYVNTGSLYRAVALKAIRSGIDTKDAAALSRMLEQTSLRYAVAADGKLDIELDGVFPGQALRAAEIAKGASDVATIPEVRSWTLGIQRATAEKNMIVMEGRDIGTVVFPDAKYKFFLSASPLARARRRLAQDGETVNGATLESVAAEIAARDKQDSERAVAPLKQAYDAIAVDNSDWTIEETLAHIISCIREKDGK